MRAGDCLLDVVGLRERGFLVFRGMYSTKYVVRRELDGLEFEFDLEAQVSDADEFFAEIVHKFAGAKLSEVRHYLLVEGGFEVTERVDPLAANRREYVLRRVMDGLSFRFDRALVEMELTNDTGALVERLMRPFREHDAAQQTPSHWMAL